MARAKIRDLASLPAVLTLKEVQDVLGISRPKTYQLAHTQGFPLLKLGRAFRVPKEALVRWLEAHTAEHRADK